MGAVVLVAPTLLTLLALSVLALDPAVAGIYVALATSLGLVASAAIGAFVSLRTNRGEKTSTAESAADKGAETAAERAARANEKLLLQRIELKKEELEQRDDKIAQLVAEQVRDRAEILRQQTRIHELETAAAQRPGGQA